jgi:hypothetical protein
VLKKNHCLDFHRISIVMSGTSSSNTNGTVIISGPDVLQISDFYVKAGVLHPIAIGSIAVVVSSPSVHSGFLVALLAVAPTRRLYNHA